MEQLTNTENPTTYKVQFHGKGSEYFGIAIVNLLLTLITLGFYYPWAKARSLQYLYGATEFNDSRFVFSGTGKEMFKGFVKAVLIFTVLYILLFVSIYLDMPVVGLLIFYLGILGLIPLAIHGSYKYRMSRTSWRSIRMGYRGDRQELFKLFFSGFFLTLITFGIYGAWFSMKLRNYVLNKIRFGTLKFHYFGRGDDYFFLNLKGYLLTLITIGIYFFWWQRDLFNYYINNLSLQNEQGDTIRLRSKVTGGNFLLLALGNLLILVLTLGLGYAWVVTRTLQFVFDNIELSGNLDLENIVQTEPAFTDATGEDVSDMLDFGFVI